MTDYYVSTTGNDGAAGGVLTPWHTLARAVQSPVTSGDIVYFRGGTWTAERLFLDYKEYAGTTIFRNYPGETPIFDQTGITPFTYEDGGVFAHACRNVTIDGLRVINAPKAGIILWGTQGANDNLHVKNCSTHTTGNSGIITYYVYNGSCFNNSVTYACMPAGQEEPVSIASDTRNFEVSYNTIYAGNRTFGATGGEGLNIKHGSKYINVHHNTVDMRRPDAQENDRYGMGVDGWDTQFGDLMYCYFWNNTIIGASYGLQYNSEEGNPTHHIYGWNNLIIHCAWSSTMQGGGIGMPPYGNTPGKVDYCYWWNNVIHDCKRGAYFPKTNIGAPIDIRNNIFHECPTLVEYGGEVNQSLFTWANNVASDSINFVDAPNHNFRLLATASNCINLGSSSPSTAGLPGAPTTGPNYDYDGISRPLGTAWDIGAFEYGLDVPPTGTITLSVR